MGFLDKYAKAMDGLTQKMSGSGSEESIENKRRIQDIFDQNVNQSSEYTVIAVGNQDKKTSVGLLSSKVTTTHYNYILGYRDCADPEMVLISVHPDLNQVGDVCMLKKSATRSKKTMQGAYAVENPCFNGGKKMELSVLVNMMAGASGYQLKVSYLNEAPAFDSFFTKTFA